MTTAEPAPSPSWRPIAAVWLIALILGTLIGILVPPAARGEWLLALLGVMIVVAFAVQLWSGRVEGFIFRVAMSALGATVVLGVLSAGFGLSLLVPV